MDDVCEGLERNAKLDREHELAKNLARSRRDERGADEHTTGAVSDQLQRARVKVVDVATNSLRRINAGNEDVDASSTGGSLRETDRRDFRIRKRHTRDRRVIRLRVHVAQSLRDDLAVVVREVREAAKTGDITRAEDTRLRFERRRIHLQPAAFRLRESCGA